MQTWLSLSTRLLLALVTPSIASLGLAFTAQAQTLPNTIFENLTLRPGFTPDPATIRGISGGEMSASEVATRTETATGACTGFVDTQPDHTIVLSEVFNFLDLQVESPEDTTLIVRGPGGTWCNDDYTGKNPGIAGQWLSGTYQIWIGSYRQNEYSPYVIRMTSKK
jgi:hypothetical protein